MIVTLIPAAGSSSRMRGRDKLLETIRGTPILRHVAQRALAANLGPVLVTLPPEATKRQAALKNLPLAIHLIPDAGSGMSASLRTGAKAALEHLQTDAAHDDEHHGMLILLPDMPEIETADLGLLNQAFQSSDSYIVRATADDGTPGHPVLFPDHMLAQFAEIKGDAGARQLLTGQKSRLVPLPGSRATRDLDTPEDWATWRKETNTPF